MAWSSATVVTGPVAEPVTLDQAKEFIAIDADEDGFDAILTGLVASAREGIETECSIRMVEQSVRVRCDAWGELAHLPIGPVTAVEHLKFEDSSGAIQLVDAQTYELFGEDLEKGIRPAVGQQWPSGLRSVSGAIELQLTVGYESLPKRLWTAVLQLVAAMFEQREGDPAPAMPHLINYRVYS